MAQNFCVWVRVAPDEWIDDRDGALNFEPNQIQGGVDGDGAFSGLRGGGVQQLGLMSAHPAQPKMVSGRRPPMQARRARVVSSFDERFDGVRGGGQWVDSVFVEGDESAAMRWIESDAGKAFVKSSTNFFLLRIGSAMDDELRVPKWVVPALDKRFPGETFDERSWSDPFLPLHLSPTPLLPEDWRVRVEALPLPDVDFEEDKKKVLRLRSERRSQLQDIVREARSARDAVQPVHAVLGLPRTPEVSVAAERLIRLVIENIDAPVFWLKRRYLRERPATAMKDAGFKPMFAEDSPYHPGHPSYPAGHATVAYALAHVYAHIDRKKEKQLLDAAKAVSCRRVIAGLHYPTDICGGETLGKWIADQIVSSNLIKQAADAMFDASPAA